MLFSLGRALFQPRGSLVGTLATTLKTMELSLNPLRCVVTTRAPRRERIFFSEDPLFCSGKWEDVAEKYPVVLSRFAVPKESHSIRTPVRRSDGRFITYKPVTPGLRHRRDIDFDSLGIHQGDPVPELTMYLKRTGGRNNSGKLGLRGRGGGPRRFIRCVDFMRIEAGPQRVVRIEVDPFRTAFLALLWHEETHRLSYIVAPQGINIGDRVYSFRDGIDEEALRPKIGEKSILLQPGNFLQMRHIPPGVSIHNIALDPKGPAVLCRAAGCHAVITETEKQGLVTVRLQSGEVRKIEGSCPAAIGASSNPDNHNVILGKAGRRRDKGFRPVVRGIAMNANDHPYGGGESPTKGHPPLTPWGKPCYLYRTRNRQKANWWVVKDRRANKKRE